MDFLKLLRSLEALLYEFALWLILIPKTFVKTLIKPRWAYIYVVAEWEKDAADRFDYYMSPLFFWIIIGVIPYLLVGQWISHSATAKAPMPMQSNFLFLAFSLLGGPLGFALTIQKVRGAAIGRRSFKRVFYTQCLCFGPPNLLVFPLFMWWVRFLLEYPASLDLTSQEPRLLIVALVVAIGGFVWWLIAETIILKSELPNWSSGRAFRIVMLGFVVSYLLVLSIGLAVGFLMRFLK